MITHHKSYISPEMSKRVIEDLLPEDQGAFRVYTQYAISTNHFQFRIDHLSSGRTCSSMDEIDAESLALSLNDFKDLIKPYVEKYVKALLEPTRIIE